MNLNSENVTGTTMGLKILALPSEFLTMHSFRNGGISWLLIGVMWAFWGPLLLVGGFIMALLNAPTYAGNGFLLLIIASIIGCYHCWQFKRREATLRMQGEEVFNAEARPWLMHVLPNQPAERVRSIYDPLLVVAVGLLILLTFHSWVGAILLISGSARLLLRPASHFGADWKARQTRKQYAKAKIMTNSSRQEVLTHEDWEKHDIDDLLREHEIAAKALRDSYQGRIYLTPGKSWHDYAAQVVPAPDTNRARFVRPVAKRPVTDQGRGVAVQTIPSFREEKQRRALNPITPQPPAEAPAAHPSFQEEKQRRQLARQAKESS